MNSAITGAISNTDLYLQLKAAGRNERSQRPEVKEKREEKIQKPPSFENLPVGYQAIPPSLVARLHFRTELEQRPELDVRI